MTITKSSYGSPSPSLPSKCHFWRMIHLVGFHSKFVCFCHKTYLNSLTDNLFRFVETVFKCLGIVCHSLVLRYGNIYVHTFRSSSVKTFLIIVFVFRERPIRVIVFDVSYLPVSHCPFYWAYPVIHCYNVTEFHFYNNR